MPRVVDTEKRKEEILDAALAALDDGGFATFTMRSLGRRIGGSSTLVTHYFPSRESIIAAVIDRTVRRTAEEVERLHQVADLRARLRAALEYFVPTSEADKQAERRRIALLAYRGIEPSVDDYYAKLEPMMRGVLSAAIDGAVPPEEAAAILDLVRLWVNGMALSVVEHPEIWTGERQTAALEKLLSLLPISDAAAR